MAEGLHAKALPALKSLYLYLVGMGEAGLRGLLTGLEAQPRPFLYQELKLGAAGFSQEAQERVMAFNCRSTGL